MKLNSNKSKMQYKAWSKIKTKLKLPQVSKIFAWDYFWFGPSHLERDKLKEEIIKLLPEFNFVEEKNLIFTWIQSIRLEISVKSARMSWS